VLCLKILNLLGIDDENLSVRSLKLQHHALSNRSLKKLLDFWHA